MGFNGKTPLDFSRTEISPFVTSAVGFHLKYLLKEKNAFFVPGLFSEKNILKLW